MDHKSDPKASFDDSETASNMVVDLEKSLPYPHQQHARVGAAHYPANIAPTLTIKHSPVPVHRLSRMTSEASAARRIAAGVTRPLVLLQSSGRSVYMSLIPSVERLARRPRSR
jgi:hypothetical protein